MTHNKLFFQPLVCAAIFYLVFSGQKKLQQQAATAKRDEILMSNFSVAACPLNARSTNICFGKSNTASNATAEQSTTAKYSFFRPGEVWYDEKGEVINAHGGGILYANKKYYWFGEKRGAHASQGVNVYSSTDLYNWKFEALALAPSLDSTSDIAAGCIMERPKVVYNAQTKKYVLWFHLEMRGQGYKAARAAVAVSDNITGPYQFVNSFRPNGNMSRDMTVYVDDDNAAYLVYASRENYDMRIAKLTDDFLSVTPDDKLLFSKHREAPAVFKTNGKYYLLTSACTGWTPNKATLHEASSIWGPWVQSTENPMKGPDSDSTYHGQSTFVLPVVGKKDAYIFIADKWNPKNLTDSRYLWLPVQLNDGEPVVEWKDEWNLKSFGKGF